MILRNKATGKLYPMSKAEFDLLGSKRNAFTIVDGSDGPDQSIKNQVHNKKDEVKIIEKKDQPKREQNRSRPSTGESKK